MSVYVDKAIWKFRGQLYCHMVADSLDELHVFAKQMVIAKSWFHKPPKASYPHYDVISAKRDFIIDFGGAIEVDRRILIAKAKILKLEWIELDIIRKVKVKFI